MTLFFPLILFPCLQLAPTSKSHFLLTLENFLVYAFCLQFYFPLHQTIILKSEPTPVSGTGPSCSKAGLHNPLGESLSIGQCNNIVVPNTHPSDSDLSDIAIHLLGNWG